LEDRKDSTFETAPKGKKALPIFLTVVDRLGGKGYRGGVNVCQTGGEKYAIRPALSGKRDLLVDLEEACKRT